MELRCTQPALLQPLGVTDSTTTTTTATGGAATTRATVSYAGAGGFGTACGAALAQDCSVARLLK